MLSAGLAGGADATRACSTRSGSATRWRPGCSTSTCTSSTRSPARRRSTACGSPAARVRRPDRTLATADHNVPTDGTPVAARIKDELSRVQVQTLERNCAEFGIPRVLARLRAPGDRARDRPRARRHPAGDDDRLRRLAHRHPRRVRRARVRDRHERGRARARHPVPGAVQAALDADPLRGRARLRRHRQGPDPGDDRSDRASTERSATSSSTPARRSRRCRWRAG